MKRGLMTVVALLVVWGPVPASAATTVAGKDGVRLTLKGSRERSVGLCGRQVKALVVTADRRVVAVVSPTRSHPSRRRTSLRSARCVDGRWQRGTVSRLSGRRRVVVRIDTSRAGDYRIRGRVAGRRVGPAYLRVSPPRSKPAPGGVTDVPVVFRVKNTNTSGLLCPSDGAEYTVRGHLVGPASVLDTAGPKAATLYLHGLAAGEWFWRFADVPGYDYALELAKAGHVSVTIDRLGYDSSDRPHGLLTCIGSDADVAHQIVTMLRAGSYGVASGSPVRFARVALAGHSLGGATAQVAAYSYRDIDALVVIGYADNGGSSRAQSAAAASLLVCAGGGESAEGGGPRGYARFGQTEADFRALFLHSAEPRVADAAVKLANANPCGDVGSLVTAVATDSLRVREIDVPVLLVGGSNDVLFSPAAMARQKGLYTGTSDVTLSMLDNTAHGFTVEATARQLRSTIGAWLAQRGL